MCGIFGVFFGLNLNIQLLIEKSKALTHRGKDGHSYVAGKNNEYMIAHLRHIVIDKFHGGQPFKYGSEGEHIYWIMNSEVYNHKEIKQTIDEQYHLDTTSDSAVVGYLYQQMGQEEADFVSLVQRMDGKFAFILYDEKKNFLFVGRDHMGLCPMYWGHNKDGSMYFASELKAIEGICENYTYFPPGHLYTSTGGIQKWYDPSWQYIIPSHTPIEVACENIKRTLTDACKKRLMSDVPVAFLLSGGLDSSLICSIIKRLVPDQEIHTFSIGLKGSPDLLAAREVADFIGTVHREYHFTVDEAIDATKDVVYFIESFEQVRASVPMYLLTKKIREEGYKVVLSGEGSDEIFGGYLYFHYAPNREEMHRELVRKVTRLHQWDVLRANKTGHAGGVEVRCPYLDRDFIEVVMNTDPQLKMCNLQERPDGVHLQLEKYLLRKAFDDIEHPYLPERLLWRQKEQFSDGVGYDWVDGLKRHSESLVSEEEWAQRHIKYPFDAPRTKEYYYLRQLFESHFPSESANKTVPKDLSIACSTPEAIHWNKQWQNTQEISGRALKIHEKAYDDDQDNN